MKSSDPPPVLQTDFDRFTLTHKATFFLDVQINNKFDFNS
jgi:hypothetical protein